MLNVGRHSEKFLALLKVTWLHKADGCLQVAWQNEEAEERTPSDLAEKAKRLDAKACGGSPSILHSCESLAVGIMGTHSFSSACLQGQQQEACEFCMLWWPA